MAKRKTSCIRITTEDVQGEGSWAIVRKLNVREQRKFRKMFADKELTAFEIGVEVMKQNVIAWDWVDDDGEPLPQPKDHPEVIDLLTDAEVEVLGNAIRGSGVDDLKNSESGSPKSSG